MSRPATESLGMSLKKVDRKFQDGVVIFKEGDHGHSAFVVVSGQVEILKKTAKGLIRLALVTPGEVFGEQGVVDKSNRSVTARAIGDVSIEEVKQSTELITSQDSPTVENDMKELAQSVGRAKQELVLPASGNLVNVETSKINIWTLIGDLIAKRRSKKRWFEVCIAPILGDERGVNASRILSILGGTPEIRAEILSDESMDKELIKSGYNLKFLGSFGQQLLRRQKVDLLIIGEVNPISSVLQLRFLSRRTEVDQPGNFLVTDRLSLPGNFSAEYGRLLFAVVAAAIVPKSETYRLMIHPLLINALDSAQETSNQPPLELPLVDQAAIQVCYGHVVAKIGNLMGDTDKYHKAAIAYQEAVENITKETDQVEWSNLHFHLGNIRHELGDKRRDKELLESALESYDQALTFFTIEDFPWEWALLKIRTGNVFYRLDSIKNDIEILKKAVAAYQSSFKVINRKIAPLKWSEVKNSLGQALQVWGDATKNSELLELAVKCCQEALLVRSREETPLPWAITNNNRGSALFLLGRQIDSIETIESSVEAFGKALSIYNAYGNRRLRQVTERNLVRVEGVLNKMRVRQTAKVDWEVETPEVESQIKNKNNQNRAPLT